MSFRSGDRASGTVHATAIRQLANSRARGEAEAELHPSPDNRSPYFRKCDKGAQAPSGGRTGGQ